MGIVAHSSVLIPSTASPRGFASPFPSLQAVDWRIGEKDRLRDQAPLSANSRSFSVYHEQGILASPSLSVL